jgi:predicted TIM-barrel fold metal-dependent hydrolase
MKNGLQVIDADSHVFEPAAVWEQYLEPAYRVAARSAFYYHEDEDAAGVILNGRQAPLMHTGRINRCAIWRPGMTPEQIGALDPNRSHPINPGASSAAARLADMDAMGVDQAVIFPTLFGEYLPAVENPDLALALSRAYNDWIRDLCQAAPQRLFPAAVLPLQDVGFAIQELHRVAGLGFKAVSIRPVFFEGRFLNHPYYDVLWRRLEESGLTAALHASPGVANAEWTSTGSYVERVAANLRIGHNVAESISYTMDNAIAGTTFTYGGYPERFPRLKLAYTHGGIGWVSLMLEKTSNWAIFYMFNDINLDTERVFYQRPYLVTFNPWESAAIHAYEAYKPIGAWGSRYPHHDASSATDALERFEKAGLPHEVIASYMGANAARVYGIGQ